ncbi:glycoside hydrolase family 15 protein [Streptomyces sp. NPDC048717]|uniref:glycoside hydrolase family 15 protein n=1 Tax=Streptomyces sp. NPDC048717 TaxID=3154928 RepID=UPI003423A2E9
MRRRAAVRTAAPGASPGLIEDHGLIGDQRGSALVRRDGFIDWLCMPRFDSDAVFASILGTAEHGFWHLAPAAYLDGATVPASCRRYVGDSMVLETWWSTDAGTATVTDFMVPGGGTPRLVRIVTGLTGQVTVRSLLRARPGYGRTTPRITEVGAFTIGALADYGYLREAQAWISWMVAAGAGTPGRRRIMYGVGGERELAEQELDWLPAYEGSAPVRIGNGAAGQLQIDVYGELADVLYDVALADPGWTRRIGSVVVGLATELEKLWDKPDAGIWEVRGPQQHFVHSKIMAWTAFDRAIGFIERGHAEGPVERWRVLRAAIHAEVCEKGFDDERNTFTQSYGSTELDASLLHAMLTGFLPADDKRVIGTVEAVQRELGTDDGLVLRYRTSGDQVGLDGFPDDESCFLICSGWLAECLALIGRPDEARTVLDSLLAVCNGLGLLAEEYDPVAGRQLGNFSQGLSQIGLLGAVRTATADLGGARGRGESGARA